jgi:general L-amino acid transport system substrate-binding protein
MQQPSSPIGDPMSAGLHLLAEGLANGFCAIEEVDYLYDVSADPEAVAAILDGEIFIHSHCYRQDEILMLIRLAEEFGITSENIEEFLDADPEEEPDIANFLGIGGFDPGLGLDPDFAVNVIQQVGNYEEIYNRNVGPETSLGLERGPNSLWTEGGLLYPPPYR